MREIKYRAFIKDIGVMCPVGALYFGRNYDLEGVSCHIPNGYVSTKNVADVYLMQYTGLKDKNGVEIYEYSELDGTYEVVFKDLKYSLRHISNNDIIDLHDYWRGKNGEIEVTREYTKV